MELGALDADGRITDGRPAPARPAAAAAPGPHGDRRRRGRGEAGAREAAQLAALLVERGLGGDAVDLAERLERFRRDRSRRAEDMRRLAEGWARASSRPGLRPPPPSPQGGRETSAGFLLALAYPDRIAKARGRPGEYVMANGRGAALEAHERLAREPFLAVAEIAGGGASARILAAAALTPAELETAAGARIVESEEVAFERGARALRARALRRLGAVTLAERPLARPGDARDRRHPRPRHRRARPRRPALVEGAGAMARARHVPAPGGGRGVARPLR